MKGPAPVKAHPLAFLNAERATELIDAVNALAQRRVMLSSSMAAPSSQQVAGQNSLLFISRQDLTHKAGLRRNNLYTDGRGCVPGQVGDLYLGGAGPQVSTPGGCETPTQILVNAPFTDQPGQGGNGSWYPGDSVLVKGPGGWQFVTGPAAAAHYRSKGATATLCGFPEYAFPAIPPKAYRTKTTTGTSYLAFWPVTGCPATIPADVEYNQAFSLSVTYTRTHGGSVITCGMVFSGTFYWKMHAGASQQRLVISWGAHTGNGDGVTWHSQVYAVRPGNTNLTIGDLASIFDNSSLDTGWVAGRWDGTGTETWSQIAMVSGMTGSSGDSPTGATQTQTFSFYPTGTTTTSWRDIWNRVDQYTAGPSTCVLNTADSSTRYVEPHGPFPLLTGGALAGGPPALSDYSGLYSEALDALSRRLTMSNSCATDGGTGSKKAYSAAPVVEALTDEDTEDAAITRVMPADWTDPGNPTSFKQLRNPGQFSLAFQVAEVAADLTGLVVGSDYVVTFELGSRFYGGGAAFIPTGDTIVISLTATAAAETTPFQVLPTPNSGEEIGVIKVTIGPP